MTRSHARLLVGFVLLSACGGQMSLPEYAEAVEELVFEMNAELSSLEEKRHSGPRTVASEKEHYAARVDARHEFMDAFRDLDPPARVTELHERALVVLDRLVDAEEAVSERAAAADSFDDLGELWSSDLLQEFLAADADAHELCLAAQESFDATEESAVGEGTLWVPREMREVVRVALQCEPLAGG